jgi:tetratricopeptide (TPR) repeat protein
MTISRQFIEDLHRALDQRRVSDGVAMLDRAEASWAKLLPGDVHMTDFLLLIAQWVDIGYRDHHLLDPLLAKVTANARRRLPLENYLRLRTVEGFRALSAEEADTAIETLDFVLRAEPGTAGEYLITLAHFWKGRAHRKKGEYESALEEVVAARLLAQKSHRNPTFSAVIQIHEAWLLFQKGLRKEALRLLAHSEAALKTTDHTLVLGSIESARGRILRRSGEYAKALEHFDRAIAIYSEGNPNHRHLARVLVNAAYVKRLLALQLRKKIDARAHNTNRPVGSQSAPPPNDPPSLRVRHHNFAARRWRNCEERERSTSCMATPWASERSSSTPVISTWMKALSIAPHTRRSKRIESDTRKTITSSWLGLAYSRRKRKTPESKSS